MRILVVDDSGTARMFIRRCLEIIGIQGENIIEAENGKDALDKMKIDPVDLVLTDLTMPVMDGETLLKRIKSNPRFFDLPVLIISSAGNPAKDEELKGLGALGVLAKPISPSKLNIYLEKFFVPGGSGNES